MVRIADDSRRIAEDSKADSYAMKTIAVLTTLFLPGTFVAVCAAILVELIETNIHGEDSPSLVALCSTSRLQIREPASLSLDIGGFIGW
jgi:hypothetical protein